jgi:hypothetical protein
VRLEAAWVAFPSFELLVLSQHPSFARQTQATSSSRLFPTRQAPSTEQYKARHRCALSARFRRAELRRLHTPQRPRASECCTPTHPYTAMLNLRSALVVATLAVSTLAAPQITVPAAGATIPVTAATQIEVTWKDDGEAPKISTLQSFTLQLIVGGNTDTDSVGLRDI